MVVHWIQVLLVAPLQRNHLILQVAQPQLEVVEVVGLFLTKEVVGWIRLHVHLLKASRPVMILQYSIRDRLIQWRSLPREDCLKSVQQLVLVTEFLVEQLISLYFLELVSATIPMYPQIVVVPFLQTMSLPT